MHSSVSQAASTCLGLAGSAGIHAESPRSFYKEHQDTQSGATN